MSKFFPFVNVTRFLSFTATKVTFANGKNACHFQMEKNWHLKSNGRKKPHQLLVIMVNPIHKHLKCNGFFCIHMRHHYEHYETPIRV